MGVTTVYYGYVDIDGIVPKEVFEYINNFSKTRHIKRNNKKIKELFENYAECIFEFSLGKDGEFFVLDNDEYKNFLWDKDDSVIDYNCPPETQPGLWCQWILEGKEKSDGYYDARIVWDKCEKFYDGANWLKYIIDNFLAKKGLLCSGCMSCINDYNEVEYIVVSENKVYTYENVTEATEKAVLLNGSAINIVVFKKMIQIKKEWYEKYFGGY